jgi:hypothetical protein
MSESAVVFTLDLKHVSPDVIKLYELMDPVTTMAFYKGKPVGFNVGKSEQGCGGERGVFLRNYFFPPSSLAYCVSYICTGYGLTTRYVYPFNFRLELREIVKQVRACGMSLQLGCIFFVA